MRIGKQDNRSTAISTSDATSITVRGKDLCSELIGHMGFTDYFFLLLTGKPASDNQRVMLDAVLLAIAEHGLVPSVQAARMTYAAGPEAMQGAVAAGLLGCGSVVLGSTEAAGRFLSELLEDAGATQSSFDVVARRKLLLLKAAKSPIPGFGHPQHSGGDPRADRLLQLAAERQSEGDHIKMLRAVEAAIPEVYGRSFPINVSGAIPGVMLDVDFPINALKGIPILARTAGLIAHLNEEVSRPIGFVLSHHAAQSIDYDGL